jgi:hypothetical protein
LISALSRVCDALPAYHDPNEYDLNEWVAPYVMGIYTAIFGPRFEEIMTGVETDIFIPYVSAAILIVEMCLVPIFIISLFYL